jgi:hypothetical protein
MCTSLFKLQDTGSFKYCMQVTWPKSKNLINYRIFLHIYCIILTCKTPAMGYLSTKEFTYRYMACYLVKVWNMSFYFGAVELLLNCSRHCLGATSRVFLGKTGDAARAMIFPKHNSRLRYRFYYNCFIAWYKHKEEFWLDIKFKLIYFASGSYYI